MSHDAISAVMWSVSAGVWMSNTVYEFGLRHVWRTLLCSAVTGVSVGFAIGLSL